MEEKTGEGYRRKKRQRGLKRQFHCLINPLKFGRK